MELQILHWFESLHNPILNPIMYGITSTGNIGLIWIILTALMLFLLPKKYKKVGLSMAIALLLSLLMCNGVMKNAFQRTRPFVTDPSFENLYGVFSTIHDWSFPSGHTSASFAAAVAIFMWYKKEGTFALVYAALVALSRLYLTVHYPTDVLASLILGCIYGIIGYFLGKFIIGKSEKLKKYFI